MNAGLDQKSQRLVITAVLEEMPEASRRSRAESLRTGGNPLGNILQGGQMRVGIGIAHKRDPQSRPVVLPITQPEAPTHP